MAISLRTGSAYSTVIAASTSITATIPAAVAVGDEMHVVVATRDAGGTTITAPTGWEQVGAEAEVSTTGQYAEFVKTAVLADTGGSATATFSNSQGTNTGWALVLCSWVGVDATAVSATSNGLAVVDNATMTHQGLTPAHADTALTAMGVATQVPITDMIAPSGMTEIAEALRGTGTASYLATHLAHQLLTGGSGVAIANKTSTHTGADSTMDSVAGMTALNPATDITPPAAPTGLTATVTTE